MEAVTDYDPLLDTVALAALLDVRPATVRSWARRRKLTRRGTDDHRRALYSVRQASELVEHRNAKPA